MHTAKLRSVGGSTMVAIPPHIIEELRLGPNSTVRLTVERGKIVIRPQPRTGPHRSQGAARHVRFLQENDSGRARVGQWTASGP